MSYDEEKTMYGTRKLAAVAGAATVVAAMAVAAANGPALASPGQGPVPLPGSAVPFAAHTMVTGEVASSQRLTIQVWLRPRLAAAASFATAVSTPGSAQFRHYLSPRGYTARYGPGSSEVGRVVSWLHGKGFAGIHTDPQRDYVRATASVATIDAAFAVRLEYYHTSAAVNAGRYRLRANDRAVSIPASLARAVLGVTGLDNAAPILPLDSPSAHPGASDTAPAGPCSHYYGQHIVTGLPKHFGTTSFPTRVCGYSAGQLRGAYGASDAATGKGQKIALVEVGLTPDMFRTLRDYAAANNMPAPDPSRYSELSLGRDSCGDPFNIEEQLDVEASYDMAPGASQLVVGGDSCNQGDFGLQASFDAETAILNGSGSHPLATVASNSWESGNDEQPSNLSSIEQDFLVRAAAEGVGMYFSSGDGSGVQEPSTNPYAIGVGGTDLGLGKNGNRLFETGWSTSALALKNGAWVPSPLSNASGGGPSLLWRQPGYQKGVVPAALAKAPGTRGGGSVRSAPDISADADYFTGFLAGRLKFTSGKPPHYIQFPVGGTSLATPLVAGMVTAAQQGQHSSFGFLNPLLYKLAGTSAFTDTLPLTRHSPPLYRGVYCPAADRFCGSPFNTLPVFDDQSYRMPGYTGQVTLPGYDNMTGLGTPNGQQFISALRNAG